MAPAPARPPAPAQLPLGGSRELHRLFGPLFGWANRPASLTALVLVGALWGFAHVVEDYLAGDPLVRWDLELARWLHEHASHPVVQLFSAITWAGNAIVLAGLTGLVLLALVRRRRIGDALFLTATALGIEVVNGGLKLLFHRSRPELSFVHLDTYSFPSGHAAGSAAVYAAFAYLLVRSAPLRWRLLTGAATGTLIVLVGVSRLVLGAHYLSDVLAGTALGLAWWAACLLVLQLRRNGAVTR